MSEQSLQVNTYAGGLVGRFLAMGCPCEIVLYGKSADLKFCLQQAYRQILELEAKYSRYVDGNIVACINAGQRVEVDNQTQHLLDFAAHCYQLSCGLFDITSGILRKVWRFTQGAVLPEPEAIEALLPLMGWDKVDWQPPYIQLPPDMQIDLGGVVKEYAVDQVSRSLAAVGVPGFLVNLGGDIYVEQQELSYPPWRIGVERPQECPAITLELHRGGVATSGSTHRFFCHQGRRFGHILNPKTGWPVEGAPQSITVVANSCTEAGLWSTLAMLQGMNAEAFLEKNSVQSWCYR